ncbi:MAG: DNA gyrase subunit A [Proteobacteria bacterium]|nr:DNA gyrase subunit A [Pseudomonadota bacterium]
MRKSYLDYAMSVIVSRALPDVRDGLKPVHRRILYAMKEGGYDWNRAFRKSARIVGDVMGTYHPHGDSAIYDAMVRMVQDFSMRVPLIEGQGNFGSMDGDPPAAMRYTEARLARSAEALLADIDKETVDFQPNYDESTKEPTVLPAEFPNLLVNGAGGIAVGMATNIAPHNLGEVGLREAAHFGRGSVVMRARTHIEEIRKDREAIVATEIPYQVNKARMVERIAELVHEKVIEGISDLRDESDRDGVRVVIELKRDASADVVLNQLFRHSQLQTSFGVNSLALNRGRPEMLGLKPILEAFVEFRREVITRRTTFQLGKARDRAHILVGLAIAVANIDKMIALIRSSPDPVVAKERLIAEKWPATDVAPLIALIDEPGRVLEEGGVYRLSDAQARAILELRLQRLTGLERDKIAEELAALGKEIVDLLDILGSRPRLMALLRAELVKVKEAFATPRRSQIEDSELDTDIEDLIQREDMAVTVSHLGYVKRVPLSTYRAQNRGGKGRVGMATREEDYVETLFVANTHTPVLFFTTGGRAFQLKVWRLPEGAPQARGKPVINLLPSLAEGERIATILPLPASTEEIEHLSVMFATSKGEARRNALSDFINIKANGKIAMKLEDDDGNSLGALVGVVVCRADQDVLLASREGKCIRFSVDDVRVFSSRTSTGVRGIRLAEDDEVISISVLNSVPATTEERDDYLRIAGARRRQGGDEAPETDEAAAGSQEEALARLGEARYAELAAAEEFLLTVTEKGFGKRSSAYVYRATGRGGSGIANIDVTPRNGTVVASFPIAANDEIMLMTDGGQLIRTPVRDVRIAGRKTQGVTLLRVDEGDRVVSVTRIADTETADAGTNGTGTNGANGAGANGSGSNGAGANGGEEA